MIFRGCVGKQLAETSIWMAVATVLAAFNIKKATDENGEEITPSSEFISGVTRYPLTMFLGKVTELTRILSAVIPSHSPAL
jgi:hypothetical protein